MRALMRVVSMVYRSSRYPPSRIKVRRSTTELSSNSKAYYHFKRVEGVGIEPTERDFSLFATPSVHRSVMGIEPMRRTNRKPRVERATLLNPPLIIWGNP